VRTVDSNNETVGQWELVTSPLCVEIQGASLEPREAGWLLLGAVPIDPDAERLELLVDGALVHIEPAPRRSDEELAFSWRRPRGPAAGTHDVSWTFSEQSPSTAFVLDYSWDDGRRWVPLNLAGPESSVQVDFDALPGGDSCRLQVRAGDQGRVALARTGPFAVARKGVSVQIQSPQDGAVLAPGPLVLEGYGFNPEAQSFLVDRLTWSSNESGPLATGHRIGAMFDSGTHTVTLTEGTSGAQASVTFVCAAPGPDIEPSLQ
jgi:hypothetical protein